MFQVMKRSFVQATQTNATLSLTDFWAELAKAMTIATELFKRGVADPQQS